MSKNKWLDLLWNLPKLINMIVFVGLHYLLTFILFTFFVNYNISRRPMCMANLDELIKRQAKQYCDHTLLLKCMQCDCEYMHRVKILKVYALEC